MIGEYDFGLSINLPMEWNCKFKKMSTEIWYKKFGTSIIAN